jgi:biopolymer transport protein ExbD
MAMSGGKDDGSPMMEMNTTPLIDVMLVLLIMFIITIPVANHAVTIDLPAPNDQPPPPVTIKPDKNKLNLTAQNQILWNGVPLSEAQLVTTLRATKAMAVEPELQFEPEAYASYEIANRLMRDITLLKLTKFGFVHNELYATFNKQ